MVTTTTPGGQRLLICTYTRTGRHLATFTCRPGTSLYTLATKPSQVVASAQVSESGPVAPPCLCCLLSHQTLLWHHRLGHPSLPCLHGMHSRLLVSGLPRSLPPLSPSPAPPCLPCVEGRQRAAPHSSPFPPMTAPLQTLHMDRFRQDLPVLRLHFDTSGEFSSDLLRDFCRWEGILHSFTLPTPPQQNGIAERRIGLVMEVARTSMIHAAAPHFLWPFVGPAPSGVSQVDPLPGAVPIEIAVCLDAARGAASGGAAFGGVVSGGAASGGAEPARAEPRGAEPLGGAEPADAEPGGAESEGAEFGGAEPRGPARTSPRLSPQPEPLSPQQLCKWFAQCTRLRSGAAKARGSAAGGTGAGGTGATSLGGVGVSARAGGTGGAGAAGPGGARAGGGAGGTGASGAGAGGAGAGDPGAGGAGAGGTGAGSAGAGGAGAGGIGAVDHGAGGAGAGGAVSGGIGAGGTEQRRPFFVLPQPHLCCHLTQSFTIFLVSRLLLAFLLAYRVHRLAIHCQRYSQTPHCLLLLLTLGRLNLLQSVSTTASPLVAKLVVFAAACRLDYATSLVAESEFDFFCVSWTAMDVEMASWKSTGTYVDAVPPSRANIVDGMWNFRVKRPPGSPPVFKARYVAQGFDLRQGVVQRFRFQFSLPQSTPLPTGHPLSTPPSDKCVELSGPYPVLVGCLITLGMGLVLGGRGPVVLTGHADASSVDDLATQRSSQGYTFSLGFGSVSWRSTRSSSVLSSSCEAEIYAGAMAAQELRWLTYLLTDLEEQPRSPPVLYVDNKAVIALCQEHRLEHRMKHTALSYFLARDIEQRGQLRLAYMATRANTAYIFTKALQPGDHQHFSTVLGLVPTLPHLLTA
ncbi:unnamed protein product [Closterium sp. NIES-54]